MSATRNQTDSVQADVLKPPDVDGASFRFSTETMPPAQRFSYFRETVGSALGGYDFTPLNDDFSCSVRFWQLPHLSISEIASAATRATRARQLASDRSKDLTLVIMRGGGLAVSQLHREATLDGTDAVLLSRADPLSMENRGARQIFVSMRRADLAPMAPKLDAALMSPMRGDADAMRLLAGYLGLVMRGAAATSPEVGRLAAAHVHDLLALALGATRDAAEIASGRGLRTARLRAIRMDIARNLGSELSAGVLAIRQRVTPRYIHKLFESEGTTLSRYILGQRLAHVHRLLTDPRCADLTISAMVYRAGFGDLSTFNREFRRHYGMTPTEVRAASQLEQRFLER
jgi:AraC-like DNA-binding protein